MELMITAKGIEIEYNGKELLDIPELQVYDYDRIGLVGRNGAGKSTLLKLLYGNGEREHGIITRTGSLGYMEQLVPPPEERRGSGSEDIRQENAEIGTAREQMKRLQVSGVSAEHRNGESGIDLSPKAVIGYYSQLVYQEKSTLSMLEYLKACSEYPVSRVISALYQMGFEERDLRKKMNVLSGGELAKVYLTGLFIGNYNILLLDEPSNFLDTEAIDALEAFIREYRGTVIFVSHDQKLNENAADLEYRFTEGKLIVVRDEPLKQNGRKQ